MATTYDPRFEIRWPDWSAEKFYGPNRAVCYNGTHWRSKVTNQNVVPVEGATWTQIGGGGGGGPHAASHATGQGDAVSPASIGAATDADLDALADLLTDHIAVAATDSELTSGLSGKADLGHIHDDRYYLEAETNALLADKSDLGHQHNASDVNAGTLAIARIPTGQTGTTVPFGNDLRFSDARTPLAHAFSSHTGIPTTLAGYGITDAATSAALTAHTGAAAPHSGHLQLGGQLGGTATAPDVRGVRTTTGPTLLTMGAVADGEYLRRSGTSVIGSTPSGGGAVKPLTVGLGGYVVLTNVGAAFDAIAMSRGLGNAEIDFAGCTRIDFGVRVNKLGTGTQRWQLWNDTDGAELILISDSAAAGDNKNLTGFTITNLPTGVKRVRVRANSSVAADDPVYYCGWVRVTY